MKFICFYMLFASLSLTGYGQSTSNENQSANAPFILSLGFNKEARSPDNIAQRTFKVGSEISLRFRKTNISDKAIPRLGPENGSAGCIVDVRDGNGNPAPPHKNPDGWIKGGGPSLVSPEATELRPGESMIDYIPVGHWFDLTHPGTYSIQIWQHVSKDPGSAVVKSNKISITITQ